MLVIVYFGTERRNITRFVLSSHAKRLDVVRIIVTPGFSDKLTIC